MTVQLRLPICLSLLVQGAYATHFVAPTTVVTAAVASAVLLLRGVAVLLEVLSGVGTGVIMTAVAVCILGGNVVVPDGLVAAAIATAVGVYMIGESVPVMDNCVSTIVAADVGTTVLGDCCTSPWPLDNTKVR